MNADRCSGLMGPRLYGTADFSPPCSREGRGFLRETLGKHLFLTRKAAVVGVWMRPMADVVKCLLPTTCNRRNSGSCWCEAVTWGFVWGFLLLFWGCFFFFSCLESQQTILAGDPQDSEWLEVSHYLMKMCRLCELYSFSRWCLYNE